MTLRTDVPVDARPRGDAPASEPDRAAAHALFKELEFQALAREYAPEAGRGGRPSTGCCSTRRRSRRPWREAREAGRVALGVVVTSAQAMRAEAARDRARRGRPGAPSTCRSPTRDRPAGALPASEARRAAPAAARGRGRPQGLGARASATGRARRRGVALDGLAFDALIASYLLDPGRRGYGARGPGDRVPGRAARSAGGDGVAAAGGRRRSPPARRARLRGRARAAARRAR